MKILFSSIAFATANFLLSPNDVDGHGHMYSPRSRNWVSYEDGTDLSDVPATPPKDYCYYCLNKKAADDVCGVGNAQSYDDWNDSAGNPMPWVSQATYVEGEVIEIKSYLHTPHWGHQDVMICPDGNDSTQECFEAHPLEFVEDLSYGAPKDENNPGRGHYTGAFVDFTMTFKLPMGVTGEKVLMQWRYVTANSCWPPGYESYPYDDAKGGNSLTCTYPLDPTGATGTGKPEQFWNCAEITILPSGPTQPPAPTTPPVPTTPVPTPPPTLAPVAAPTAPACCSWPPYEECSQPENTWCQANQQNCEGSCSGKWLNGAPPPTNAPASSPTTPAPVPSSPATPAPAPSSPTTPARGCCSIDFKTCHHDEGTFCWESEENCTGPCGKYWLPTGPIEGCAAQWDPCGKDDDCCGPATCDYDGVCRADGWNYTPSPTTPPPASTPTTPAPVPTTPPPVSTPTTPAPAPTSSPSAEPTEGKRTASPVATDDACCTWNLYNCGVDGWCNEKEENCHAVCGGVWIEKTSLAMTCLAKYQQCQGGSSEDCCDSLTCQGGATYKQCL